MEPLSRGEIEEVFEKSIAPLVTEFKASHDSHEKEIERLLKQSGEHYSNYRELGERVSKQIMQCQNTHNNTQEKSGDKIGDLQKDIARIDQKIAGLEKDIEEDRSGSRFGKEMYIVIGVALFAPAITKLIFGG